jgi:hypothetical protein
MEPEREKEESPNPDPNPDADSDSNSRFRLGPNIIAAIAVSVGLAILIMIAALMCAFRIGWDKGLQYQEALDRQRIADASNQRCEHHAWLDDPDISPITEQNPTRVSSPGGASIGRHSFRPGKGVYQIPDGPAMEGVDSYERIGAGTRSNSNTSTLVGVSVKGKEKDTSI